MLGTRPRPADTGRAWRGRDREEREPDALGEASSGARGEPSEALQKPSPPIGHGGAVTLWAQSRRITHRGLHAGAAGPFIRLHGGRRDPRSVFTRTVLLPVSVFNEAPRPEKAEANFRSQKLKGVH